MKKMIISEVQKLFGVRTKQFRRFKIFGFVILIGFLACSSLMVWTGLSLIGSLKNEQNIIQISSLVERYTKEIGLQSNLLSNFLTVDCWNKVVDLTNAEYWHQTLATENLNNLKNICFLKLFDADGSESSVVGQSIEYVQRSAI